MHVVKGISSMYACRPHSRTHVAGNTHQIENIVNDCRTSHE